MLSVDNWKYFTIKNLFTCEKGSEKKTNQYQNGDVNLVSCFNGFNGIQKKINPYDKNNNIKIFKGNVITMSTHIEEGIFYQPKDFCAFDDVIVLNSIFLTENIGLFMVTILKTLNFCKRHSNFNLKEFLNSEIKLPSKDGNLDLDYMEDYIEKIKRGLR